MSSFRSKLGDTAAISRIRELFRSRQSAQSGKTDIIEVLKQDRGDLLREIERILENQRTSEFQKSSTDLAVPRIYHSASTQTEGCETISDTMTSNPDSQAKTASNYASSATQVNLEDIRPKAAEYASSSTQANLNRDPDDESDCASLDSEPVQDFTTVPQPNPIWKDAAFTFRKDLRDNIEKPDDIALDTESRGHTTPPVESDSLWGDTKFTFRKNLKESGAGSNFRLRPLTLLQTKSTQSPASQNGLDEQPAATRRRVIRRRRYSVDEEERVVWVRKRSTVPWNDNRVAVSLPPLKLWLPDMPALQLFTKWTFSMSATLDPEEERIQITGFRNPNMYSTFKK